jgi:hypothetical protein
LRERFDAVSGSSRIGGSAVLQELSDLASACVVGATAAQDAVAFALATIFQQHAEDRTDRTVTGDDNYLLMASGGDDILVQAVKFVEDGGGAGEAVTIIAALARITPETLYGRSA